MKKEGNLNKRYINYQALCSFLLSVQIQSCKMFSINNIPPNSVPVGTVFLSNGVEYVCIENFPINKWIPKSSTCSSFPSVSFSMQGSLPYETHYYGNEYYGNDAYIKNPVGRPKNTHEKNYNRPASEYNVHVQSVLKQLSSSGMKPSECMQIAAQSWNSRKNQM